MNFHHFLHDSFDQRFSFDFHQNLGWTSDAKPDELIKLNPSDRFHRRLLHVLRYCRKQHVNFTFDQYIFLPERQGEVFIRKITTIIESDNQAKVEVSTLLDFEMSELHQQVNSSLFDYVSDVFLVSEAEPYDEPGPRVLYVNEAFEKMTGFSQKEIIGKNPRLLQGEKTKQKDKKAIRSALEAWESIQINLTNYKKNGEEFEVSLNISPIKDATGWFTHWISAQRDITKYHQAYDLASKLNSELSAYVEGINKYAIVARTDDKGKISFVNDKFCEISGYAREELIGEDHRIINSAHHSKEFFHELWSTIQAGSIWQGEIKNRRKDGSFYWVDTTITPVMDTQGKITGYMAFRNDITHKKLNQIIEQAIGEIRKDYIISHQSRKEYFKLALNKVIDLIGAQSAFLWEIFDREVNGDRVRFITATENNIKREAWLRAKLAQAMVDRSICFIQDEGKNFVIVPLMKGEQIIGCLSLTCVGSIDQFQFTKLYDSFFTNFSEVLALSKLEEDLKQSQDFFNSTAELLAIIEDGVITHASNSWSKTLGYDLEEILGRQLIQFILLKDRQHFKSVLDDLTKTHLARGIVTKIECHDASTRAIQWNLKAQRGVVYITGKDITDFSKKEEEQSFVLNATKVGIWNWDIKTNELSWDQGMYTLYEVNKSDFNGSVDYWNRLVHPDDLERCWKEVELAMKRERDFDTTFRMITPLGSHKVIHSRAEIIWGENGEALRMLGVNWDITEQSQMKEELDQQKKMAMHNSKLLSIGELAAGVGHEINNPLTVIQGYTNKLMHMIDSGEDPESLKKYLEKIKLSSERMGTIVKGLRNFSRQDEGVMDDFFNPIEPIKETVDLLKEIYQNDGISLTFEVKGDLCGQKVLGNIGQFQQVIMNLLSNAKDALDGGVVKKIDITYSEGEGECTVEVQDSGQGMDERTQARIFDAFFTTKEVNAGTGIGLSLVHKIVTKMKGKIQVDSQPELGSKFTVSLPLQKEDKMHIKAQENFPRSVSPDIRCLILDDEEGILEILEDILQDHNIQVVATSDATVALDKLKQEEFDLVISDMKMPIMDGATFLKEVKKIEGIKQPKFMFITGGIQKDFDEFQELIDGYLYKPFKEDEIIQKIQELFV